MDIPFIYGQLLVKDIILVDDVVDGIEFCRFFVLLIHLGMVWRRMVVLCITDIVQYGLPISKNILNIVYR